MVSNKIVRNTIGLPIEDSFQIMTGIDDCNLLHEMRLEYGDTCRPKMAEKTHFYPDAIRFLKEMKDKNKILGIVSTKERYSIQEALDKNKLTYLFDFIIGKSDVSEAKPSPEGILKASGMLKRPVAELLYFGDSPVDGQAAMNAEVSFVAVLKGCHALENLKKYHPVLAINKYDELLSV